MIKKVLLTLTLLVYVSHKLSGQEALDNESPQTIVLVHGAWGGAWAFKAIDHALVEQGFKVYRPTLSGLGRDYHNNNQSITLQTHIADIVNLILFEKLEQVVLVGHSYGGMVISGVANALPHRIKQLLYVDAFVPFDNESVMDFRQKPLNMPIKNHSIVPPWVDPNKPYPKDVPQPLNTWTSKIILDNPERLKIDATYLLTIDEGRKKENDAFYKHYLRAKQLGWELKEIISDHNPQWSKPDVLVNQIIAVSN